MTCRVFGILVVLAVASASRAGELEVTGIPAVHRHGQTFVTRKDIAEGEAGAKFRYSLSSLHGIAGTKRASSWYRRLQACPPQPEHQPRTPS